MFYVYRFLDEKNNIIYVGKSKQDLEQRFRGHLHLPDACYDLTYKIEFIECFTESDMSIKEIYYINKYRHEGTFFNVLDTSDIPESVEFNDIWNQYMGPLDSHFHHSINYIEGYATQKEVKYNKDGSINRRKSNKKKGLSSFVDGFSPEEVNRITDYFVTEINTSTNSHQQEIHFRNLIIFLLGVNLPHKSNDFLGFRYCDLFDENDHPSTVALRLNRGYKDETIQIPLKDNVKETISAYVHYCGLNYNENATDELFQTRKHQIMSPKTWGKILNGASESTGINKNIGAESLRKTYGRNIFSLAEDKLNALVFLEKMWGNQQYGNIIAYLNLADNHVDYDYYFGELFSLGNVDLSKIECLKKNESFDVPGEKSITSKKESFVEQTTAYVKSVQQPAKKARTNRQWPKEKKLEVVLKYLNQRIPQKELARLYGVDTANISRWISEYRKNGETAFEDKRSKQK